MSLDEDCVKELLDCAEEFSYSSANSVNQMNLQDMVRAIVTSYLQGLRGPSNQELLKMKGFQTIPYKIGQCPQCHLRLDKYGFPVLKEIDEGICQCQVCGYYGNSKEV